MSIGAPAGDTAEPVEREGAWIIKESTRRVIPIYSQKVVAQRLKAAFDALNASIKGDKEVVPEYHTPSQCQAARKHLEKIKDPETGNLTRTLTIDEFNWVRNERILCQCDFLYWETRYAMIRDWADRVSLIVPNIAQKMVVAIWGEMEEAQNAILMLQLKARRLGVSTQWELATAHRVQFYSNVNAVVASSDPDKSAEMAGIMELAWQNMPWWLMPTVTAQRSGTLIEFGLQNSAVSIQHGTQFSGIARGATPSTFHLSELPDFKDPEGLIDASLLRAVIDSPSTFGGLESTAAGRGNWLHKKWKYAVQNWPSTSRLRPAFLPWYVGSDIYPTDTWLRQHPIPRNHKFESMTLRHAERATEYVKVNELLRKNLGDDWKMPPRQMWFWEATRHEYEAQGATGKFLSELCVAEGTRISTSRGILPIEQAESGDLTRTGVITRRYDNGVKPVFLLRTKKGREILATSEHRISVLSDSKWKRVSELKKGDKIKLCEPKFALPDGKRFYVHKWKWSPLCSMQIVIDETWARLLGYFMGDGSFHSNRLMIACDSKDSDVVEDISEVISQIIGKRPAIQIKGGMTLLTSSSVRWFEMLSSLGCLQPAFHKNLGRNCGWKRKVKVPDCIWKSTETAVRFFLSALFECDGHAYKFSAQTQFFAKDKEFIKDIQLLLLGFGINCYYRSEKKVNGEGRTYTGNKLMMNAIASDLFHERIEFIGRRKKSGRRRCKALGRHADEHTMQDEVLSVEPNGEARCYDLEVQVNHCYGANGILVHNCSDDIEAFQHDKHNPFGVEVITEYHNATSRIIPRVYGFVGRPDTIPERLQPDRRDIDTDKEPLYPKPLPGATAEAPRNVKLVPLRWTGASGFDPLGKLFIWRDWEPGHVYANGVDTAYGIGKDRSVIETLRKGTIERNDEQVAEFASPAVNAADLAPIAYIIGSLYSSIEKRGDTSYVKQCHQAIEVQANGEITQLQLRKMGWKEFHRWVRYDRRRINPAKAERIGWATVSWSRALLMSWCIKYLRDGWVDINSPWFVEEMQALVQDDYQQHLKAEYGEYDDRFMAFGIALCHLHMLESRQGTRMVAEERMAHRAMDDPDAPPEEYSVGNQMEPVYAHGAERLIAEQDESW